MEITQRNDSCLTHRGWTSPVTRGEDCVPRRRHGFGPWAGKIRGEGNGNPLQYSCLGNSMNRVWWAVDHGIAKGRTRLSVTTTKYRVIWKEGGALMPGSVAGS